MIRNLACFVVALTAFSGPALAQERPVLKAEATVLADVVRIGDLIDNAGIVADVAIFRAPDLGTTGTVSAAQVAEAVRAHAIVGLNTDGISEVRVTRPSRMIAAAEVEAAVAAALSTQFSLGAQKEIALTFDRPTGNLQVDTRSTAPLYVSRISFDQRNNRFDATIDVAGSSRRRLTGVAVQTVPVVTPARAMNRGDTIKASDLVVERRPRSEVSPDMLTAVEQANGFAARGALVAGRPLRNSDLTRPELVRRNESVTLVYEVPGITLTLRGKASEGGAEGDMIEVINVQSKRPVQGVITGPGRVLVTAATPTVVAEAAGSSKAPKRAQ